MKLDIWRSRWAAVGAAVAITFGGGGLFAASALGNPGDASALVPVVPVRVLDTRDAASPIHTVGANSTVTLSLVGEVPADATAASINVTVEHGSFASYLTLFPTGDARPNASAINWADAQAHANSTVVKLGTNKSFDIYNNAGTVDVIVDLVGYYVPTGSVSGQGGQGPAGPAGPTGNTGAQGIPGAPGAKGDKGDQGDPGIQGVQGDPGAKGDQGDPGAKGDQGDPGAKGDQGDPGVQGVPGTPGAPGAPGTNGTNGTNGVSGYQVVVSGAVSSNSAAVFTNTATCPAGKKAVGGGFSESTGNSLHIVSELPATVSAANDSWRIRAQRIGNNNFTFTVTAICVSAL